MERFYVLERIEIDISDDMKGNAVNKPQESTFFVENSLLIKNNHINTH